jgi:hypothetical protein
VDLVQVDIVEPEPLERRIDRCEDVLAPEAFAVHPRHRPAADLGRDDVFLTSAEEPAQDAPGQHFALALVVDVRSVEEGDATLDRAAYDRLGVFLAKRPGPLVARPEAHHPEADARDAQAGAAEVHVAHAGTVVAGCGIVFE